MFIIKIDENIELKLLEYKDAEEFYNLMVKNYEYIIRYMPRIKETKSIEDTKKVIKLFLYQFAESNGFRTGVYYQNTLIGIIGLKYIDWINRKTEIMYWIDEEFSGKGITTLCVNKLVDISFNEYGLHKVIIEANANNVGSIKIAEKCGFIMEGKLIEDELIDETYTDTYIYSVINRKKEC